MADSVIPKQQESLNRFNNEFTKTLNELKDKRKKLIKKVKRDQTKVQALQAQMTEIQKEKTTLEASLAKKEKILNHSCIIEFDG